MSTATHEIAPEEIMAHHDGELPAARAEVISAHLESCAECRDLAESLRATSQSLASWKVGATPPSLRLPRITLGRTPASNVKSWVSEKLFSNRAPVVLGTIGSIFVLMLIGITTTRAPSKPMSMMVDTATVNRAPQARQISPMELNADSRDFRDLAAPSKGVVGGHDSRVSGTDPYAGSATFYNKMPPPPLAAAPNLSQSQMVVIPHSPSETVREDSKASATDLPMIARSAELQITVKRFDDARAALQSVLAHHRGYAASLHVGDPENAARTLNASLRIPSQELPGALNELKALGRVTNESQAGEEVTAEHADLVAQLKNSRETETRLQDILRNRTGKVSDVLEVEQEIARVRGEIEQAESELKSMDHRVAFATIALTVTEEYKAKVSDSTPSISTRFRNAAIAGYENVASSALGLVLWFVEYFPPIIFWLVLLGAPAWWLWRRTQRALASVG